VISGTSVVATVPVGIYPVGVAYDSARRYVYVANQASNTVTVINGTTVVAAIPVGKYPAGVAYDSRNGYVYVVNSGSNNVSVISGTSVVATVSVGRYPAGVGCDGGTGYVYITSDGSNAVTVINGTTVVATVLVGYQSHGVAYDSGNGYVYVANSGSNTVSVISTNSPPGPPATPRNVVAAPRDGRIVLTWQPPASDGGAPVTNYTVFRGTESGSETILTILGDVLTYTDTAVTNGHTYYYQVSAVNGLGEGLRSIEVAATPMPGPGPSVLDSAIVAGILVAVAAVIVAVALIAWRWRRAARIRPPSPP